MCSHITIRLELRIKLKPVWFPAPSTGLDIKSVIAVREFFCCGSGVTMWLLVFPQLCPVPKEMRLHCTKYPAEISYKATTDPSVDRSQVHSQGRNTQCNEDVAVSQVTFVILQMEKKAACRDRSPQWSLFSHNENSVLGPGVHEELLLVWLYKWPLGGYLSGQKYLEETF